MTLDGTRIKTGTVIPTLGPATVDETQADHGRSHLTINKNTIGDLDEDWL